MRPTVLLLLASCAAVPGQRADPGFEFPDTGPPAYSPGAGPEVALDEAHHNYHTTEGRYRAFVALLRRDGYRVRANRAPFSRENLAGVDVLVIANALAGENVGDWSRPIRPAFTPTEVAELEAWVHAGGRLLLIADHMPMPGAARELAAAFGVRFHDGFAYGPDAVSRLRFERGAGLAASPVTCDVPFVTTFTGQAFEVEPGVDATPVLRLAEGSYQLLPEVAWEFEESTPRQEAEGMLQGALVRHGAGRVAVFGEAATFTAQLTADGRRMGLNHPDAPHNARFVLNVVGWLSADPVP